MKIRLAQFMLKLGWKNLVQKKSNADTYSGLDANASRESVQILYNALFDQNEEILLRMLEAQK